MKGAKDWLRFALLMGLFPSCVNDPIGRSHEVVGSGDPSIDVPAVQAAVDKGGTVTLKGSFDFGDQGVKVTKSVDISGSRTASGEYQTKIMNGFNSFVIQEGNSGPDIQVTIENLSFDGSTGSAVVINTGNVSARGNRIRNVKYGPSQMKNRAEGSGVKIGDSEGPGSIGEVIVEGNDIEINTEYDSGRHLSWGVYVDRILPGNSQQTEPFLKKIRIQRNLIRDFGEGGVFAIGSEGASILIAENQIDSGPRTGIYGIAMHRHIEAGLELGPIEISDNSITVDGLIGIGLADVRESRIEENVIEISKKNSEMNAGLRLDCWTGGTGSKNSVARGNRIHGIARYGLSIKGCSDESRSEGNVSQNNNFSNFHANVATVNLDRFTSNNSIQSNSAEDTIMDCGQDNQIEGGQRVICSPSQE